MNLFAKDVDPVNGVDGVVLNDDSGVLEPP